MIICISAKKQGGKGTCSNFIAGNWLKRNNYISDFSLTKHGLLTFKMNGHEETIPEGEFNNYFIDLPIKMYSFADPLKQFCIDVLGLKYEQCYGTDEQKNSPTHLKWEDMPTYSMSPLKHQEFMTGREVMQYLGTDIIRKMYSDAWVLGTVNMIKKDNPKLALIPDGRFPNEIDKINEIGGKTIRLLRNVSNDQHFSELALDDYPIEKYSLICDNSKMSIKEQCECLEPHIENWLKKC